MLVFDVGHYHVVAQVVDLPELPAPHRRIQWITLLAEGQKHQDDDELTPQGRTEPGEP